MLIADITYKGLYKYKGYLTDNMTGTLMRWVSKDGESSQHLLDGYSGELNSVSRTISFTKSTLVIERLFKNKMGIVNGEEVDLTAPKQYQNTESFKMFLLFFSMFNEAKTYPTKNKTLAIETDDFRIAEDLKIVGDIKDYFEFPHGSGTVTRRNGMVVALEYTSKLLRVSIVEDTSFEFQPVAKIKAALGSATLGIYGDTYKIPIETRTRKKILGYPQIDVDLNLTGINQVGGYPFFQTIEEVVQAHPEKNFDWIKERIAAGDYKIVTPEILDTCIAELSEHIETYKHLALDTETDGLKFNFKCFMGEGNKVVGYVLSAKVGTSYYFPVGHKRIKNLCNGDADFLVEHYLQPLLAGVRVITHNNFFDFRVCLANSLIYWCYFDTYVFNRKTYGARDGAKSGLKELTTKFLGRTPASLNDLCINGNFNSDEDDEEEVYSVNGYDFSDLNEELVCFYACPDADNTLALFYYFKDSGIVDAFNAWKSVRNESEFSSVVAYNQFYGMHLNLDSIPALREHYAIQLRDQEADLKDFIRANDKNGVIDLDKYTVGSAKDNVKITYDILGYPMQTNKSGNPSLDKTAIGYLSKFTKPNLAKETWLSREDVLKIVGDDKELSSWLSSTSFTTSTKKDILVKTLDEDAGFINRKVVIRDEDVKKKREAVEITTWETRLETVDGSETPKKNLYFTTGGILERNSRLLIEVKRAYQDWRYDCDFKLNEDGSVKITPTEFASYYPFVSILKRARDTTRIFTNFLDKIDTYFTKDGFCFPKVDAFKVTGRLSTSKPNIQGFDDIVKREINAREGHYMVDMDYSSKESRVIAIASGEGYLLDMFHDWRADYHRAQAALMNNIRQEQVTDADRKAFKAVNFGINFGMSNPSLGGHLYGSINALNTAKAQEQRRKYFAIQPHVEGWFNGNVDMALNKGYSETLLGSRRFYNRATTNAGRIRRTALNHPIQGSAADIYKAGMVSLFKDIIKHGYLGKVLITGFIHDEATLEVSNDIHPHVILGLLRKNMMVDVKALVDDESKVSRSCPLYIGFGVGRSWYLAKKTEWQVGLQEKMEYNVDAYPWDGDIDKYYDWTFKAIHEYNAEDVINKLDTVKPEDEKDVFPVTYALELNKFVQEELTKKWETVKDLLDLPENFEEEPNKSGYFYKLVGGMPIRERFGLLYKLTGYQNDLALDKFIDIDLLEDMGDTQVDVDLERIQLENQERERQLKLEKAQLLDMGISLDFEKRICTLLYSKDLYQQVKKHSQVVEDGSSLFRLRFYDMKSDSYKLLNIGVSQEDLDAVNTLAFMSV